jgi:hypothetical protein
VISPEDVLKRSPVNLPGEVWDRIDAVAGAGNRSKFLLSAALAMLDGGAVAPVAKPVPVSRPKPVAGLGLVSQAMAGREVVDSADKRRVLDCLGERRRSARDVAVALKMDFGTAGLVIADLSREGLIRKVAKDGMLELVD